MAKASGSRAKGSVRAPRAARPKAASHSEKRAGKKAAPQRRSRRTPLEKAQALIRDALLIDNPDRQIRLAQRALAASPDCADAYTILAEYAADARQSLQLCVAAVSAAERTLGPRELEGATGNLWKFEEARPYLRARLALAQRLWDVAERDEAIEHFAEILRLNPEDHQGVRYLLAARLLEEGRTEPLAELFRRFDETSTAWSFSKTLATFQREGDTESSRKLLEAARKRNKHVVDAILNPEKAAFGFGARPGLTRDEKDAENYIDDFFGGWRQTPGAITWLRRVIGQSRRRRRRPAESGPTEAAKRRLTDLPQRFGTEWQVSTQCLPTWVEDAAQPVRPWSLLAIDQTASRVVGQDMLVETPTAGNLFDFLSKAMCRPMAGEAHRPSEIQVLESALWESLSPHLEEIGVDCIFRVELDEIATVQQQMREMFLSEQASPGLVGAKGIELSQVASFFAAAADFYRRAPWRRTVAETVIQVECRQLRRHRKEPWYASVMGQSHESLGLALFDDLETIRAVWSGLGPFSLMARGAGSLALSFSEAFEIPMRDLLACEENHWPVGGPEAYPLVMATSGPAPKPSDLLWLEGSLRAIPEFIERHRLGENAVTETISVPTATGDLDMTLTWSPASDACGEECGGEACGDCHDCECPH